MFELLTNEFLARYVLAFVYFFIIGPGIFLGDGHSYIKAVINNFLFILLVSVFFWSLFVSFMSVYE